MTTFQDVLNYQPLFFFFQAEDGIRDTSVTGVQTCALPISHESRCGGARGPGAGGRARGQAGGQDFGKVSRQGAGQKTVLIPIYPSRETACPERRGGANQEARSKKAKGKRQEGTGFSLEDLQPLFGQKSRPGKRQESRRPMTTRRGRAAR